jgi:hypothetical protein
MKTINFVAAVAIVALGFSTSSCNKEKLDAISGDKIVTMQDDAQANDLSDDIDNEADDVVNGNSNLKSAAADTTSLSGRVVVWTTNNDGTKTAVITYTNFQNPLAKNERVKNGVVTIVVTGKRSDNTYKRVVTFTNFTINGVKIEGTKTIEKVSDFVYKITLTDGKLTFTDNTFITCNLERTRTLVEGNSTPLYIWDDAYTFVTTASGVNRNGVQYTKQTTVPVKIYTAYRFPVSGSFTITAGNNVFTLDYGDGTLDNLAMVTLNGFSKEITLRK